jgi:hypothetical protein
VFRLASEVIYNIIKVFRIIPEVICTISAASRMMCKGPIGKRALLSLSLTFACRKGEREPYMVGPSVARAFITKYVI